MRMGEKLEGQCLSRAFQGWVEISSSISPTLEYDKAWAYLAKHFPTSLFRGQSSFFCCFSNWNVEPVLSGSFKEKASLGTEAKDHQQETV